MPTDGAKRSKVGQVTPYEEQIRTRKTKHRENPTRPLGRWVVVSTRQKLPNAHIAQYDDVPTDGAKRSKVGQVTPYEEQIRTRSTKHRENPTRPLGRSVVVSISSSNPLHPLRGEIPSSPYALAWIEGTGPRRVGASKMTHDGAKKASESP